MHSRNVNSLIKNHQLLRYGPNRIGQRFNHNLNGIRNINHRDCLRFGFIYGGCGTVASFLHMQYTEKLITFELSAPTPERFVFSTFCWGMAGMTSWMLFWTRPQAIIRALSASVKYGFLNGTKTSMIAMTTSMGMLAFMSFYFDCMEFRDAKRNWQSFNKTNTAQLMTYSMNGSAHSSSTVIEIEDEEGNEREIIEDDISATVVNVNNSNNGNNVNIMESNVIADDRLNIGGKPMWNWEKMLNNFKQPTKAFLVSNCLIWMSCGSIAGLIVVRMLTNAAITAISATEASAIGMSAVVLLRTEDCRETKEEKNIRNRNRI